MDASIIIDFMTGIKC